MDRIVDVSRDAVRVVTRHGDPNPNQIGDDNMPLNPVKKEDSRDGEAEKNTDK